MSTKESFLKKVSTAVFGPSAKLAWANFTAAATLDQATVDYGGFAPLTAGTLAVNRTAEGIYTLDLTDLPSSAKIWCFYEGNVAGSVRATRSGRTITVRLFDGTPAAADLAVTVNVLVLYFEEV